MLYIQKTSWLQTRWPVSFVCPGVATSLAGLLGRGAGMEEPGHPIGLPRPHGSSFSVPGGTTNYNGIPGGSAIVRTLWCVGGLPRLSPLLLCIVPLSIASLEFAGIGLLLQSVQVVTDLHPGSLSRRDLAQCRCCCCTIPYETATMALSSLRSKNKGG